MTFAARRAFVLANTTIQTPPHVPEVALHLADEAHGLWLKTEEELAEIGLPPPFWAFAWAGGQGLARYILDTPEAMRGRTVLDLASGSGLVAIAAAMAGARRVEAADIDPFCAAAVAVNAALNGAEIRFDERDRIGHAVSADILLAGDVFYDAAFAARLTPWFDDLAAAGTTILVGDPGRAYLPYAHLSALAVYEVPVTRVLEDAEIKRTTVWHWQPPRRPTKARWG